MVTVEKRGNIHEGQKNHLSDKNSEMKACPRLKKQSNKEKERLGTNFRSETLFRIAEKNFFSCPMSGTTSLMRHKH